MRYRVDLHSRLYVSTDWKYMRLAHGMLQSCSFLRMSRRRYRLEPSELRETIPRYSLRIQLMNILRFLACI